MKLKIIVAMISSWILMYCSPDKGVESTEEDDSFHISRNIGEGYVGFDRKITVFEIPIYAVPGVDSARLIHAAHIMAQYLDNDEDGVVDNSLVVEELKKQKAFLAMWASESDLESIQAPNMESGQDLGNDETRPEWHANGKQGRFDAALEEVLHLITHVGYSRVYPDAFGEVEGSELANAMDKARGGRFTTIPDSYPDSAWYTYDDETCEYDCMATEYMYWALTSILGAQEHRLDEIGQEWRLVRKEQVQSQDSLVYGLLTNSEYRLPTKLPDGSYRK